MGVLDGVLYAVGGHDGPLVRRSVEMWRPGAPAWRPAPDMAAARRNAGVLPHTGQLMVIGGDDGTSNLNTVEVTRQIDDAHFFSYIIILTYKS